MILANFIFPAFTTPYVFPMFFPVAAIVAIAAEVYVFCLKNRDLSLGKIICTVVVINIASAAIGFASAEVLPSGLEPAVMGEGENQFRTTQPGPKYGMYAVLGYILAFTLSVLIEWGIVRSDRCIIIEQPFITVGLANVASYVVLIVLLGFCSLFL